jgi:flavin reductase (DIM6/NTAB) family NADH-FMN oxidoreductase RutF
LAKIQLAATTALFPVPAVMISSRAADSKPNIVTVAWVGTVCSEPPMVAIGLRASRHSHDLISASGEFVVNIPRSDQVMPMDYCGLVSGRDQDKFAATGLTAVPASKLQFAPLIAECPVNLECQVRQVINLGSHDLFVGEVVAVQADESVLKNNRIDPAAAEPVSYSGGRYFGLGELIAAGGVGNQMKRRG